MFKRRRKAGDGAAFAAGDKVAVYTLHSSPFHPDRARVYPGRVESADRGVVVVRGREGTEMLGVFDLASVRDFEGDQVLVNPLELHDGGMFTRALVADGSELADDLRRSAARDNMVSALSTVAELVGPDREITAGDAEKASNLLDMVSRHIEGRVRG